MVSSAETGVPLSTHADHEGAATPWAAAPHAVNVIVAARPPSPSVDTRTKNWWTYRTVAVSGAVTVHAAGSAVAHRSPVLPGTVAVIDTATDRVIKVLEVEPFATGVFATR